MDPITEIKDRISIEDLVSQYVVLKKAGRHFKALCPFHKERTPSFYISPERQLAYCFGCHKGGDHFKFIQEIEGLDFRGALEMLAEKAGVKLPKRIPVKPEEKTERDKMFAMHETVAVYFEQKLWETDDGKKVLKYLKKRGLKEETCKGARLGFAPESTKETLYAFLLSKDFSREEIITSGLALTRDIEKSECFDRFRMRLIFPLKNLAGAICGFAGRAVKEGDEPKYLNSPETPIYSKRRELFGLYESRQEIRKKDAVILVEGYMDALALHQAGFTNTVACSGTALTEEQLVILKRFTKNLFLALDRDESGKLATERALELALAQDFSVRVIAWDSKAKDPDECLREDPKIFQAALESAPPALNYLLTALQQEFNPKEISGKRSIVSRIFPLLNRIKSPIELDEWLKQIGSSLEISLTSLYDEFKQSRMRSVRSFSVSNTPQENTSPVKGFKIEEYLIGLLLTFPETLHTVNQLVRPEDFEDIQLQNIYRSLTSEYNLDLDEETSGRKNILGMLAETATGEMPAESIHAEVIEVVNRLLRLKLASEKRNITNELRVADEKQRVLLLDRLQKLLTQEQQQWPRS